MTASQVINGSVVLQTEGRPVGGVVFSVKTDFRVGQLVRDRSTMEIGEVTAVLRNRRVVVLFTEHVIKLQRHVSALAEDLEILGEASGRKFSRESSQSGSHRL